MLRDEKKELRDMAVMASLQKMGSAIQLAEYIHRAQELAWRMGTVDDSYHAVHTALTKCMDLLPDEETKLLRALDVEPEVYEYRRDYDELRAKANGDQIDEDASESYPYEHPADILEKLK